MHVGGCPEFSPSGDCAPPILDQAPPKLQDPANKIHLPSRPFGILAQIIYFGACERIHARRAGSAMLEQRHAVQAVQLRAFLVVFVDNEFAPCQACRPASTFEEKRATEERLAVGVALEQLC